MFKRKGTPVTFLATTLAVVVLAGGQSYAGEPKPAAAPAPQTACCAPPVSETAIEAALHNLTQPTLFAAQDTNVRALVRSLVSYQFDGDTNALFSTIIQEAEASYIVDPYAQEWLALKDAVANFSNINGWAYQPQIYIPNQDEGIIPEGDIVVAIAPADEYATAATGYRIDSYGQVYPIGMIDEYYVEYNEVWVLSVNEPVPNGEVPPVLAPAKAGPAAAKESSSQGGAGTLAVCNPTGLRNNQGQEYLQRWRVPNRSSFGSIFEGKREMRLQILTTSGAVVRNIIFGKVKRKHIDSWQSPDLFITTWDRAVWGDVLAYVWSEIDGGPTVTIGLSIPIPGGGTLTANVQWQARDDDGGNAVVMFSESTYTLYNTGSVEFNLCSIGGDGGTGNDNLACSATASASSTYSGYSPARVADCNPDTRLGGAYSWANNYNTYPPNNPQWVQVDFGVNKTFRRVVVYTSQGYPIRDFDVQVWNGVTFLTVASVTGNTGLSVTVTFAARTSRIVRVLGRHGPNHQPGYVRVNELEVYPV